MTSDQASAKTVIGKQPFQPVHLAVREHRLREERTAAPSPTADPIARDQQRVPDDADVRLVGVRKLLGQPALQPQRRQLRRELDDQDRISEAAERLGAVHAPGDEQERQARDQPEDEAEEVDPPAARQRRQVGGRPRCGGRVSVAQCAAPQLRAPADLDVQRHVELERRLGRATTSPCG